MGRLRNAARRLWGLPVAPGTSSTADRRARKADRLAQEAADFAAVEAKEQRRLVRKRRWQSELSKAELEQRGGVRFPGD